MSRDLREGEKYSFDLLLTPDGIPVRMHAKVVGTQTITVPAGTFECLEIVLEPDFEKIMGKWSWASTIVSPFVPEQRFWVNKAAPHVQVKFKGVFGPKGATPLQAYELVEKPE